MRKVLDRICVSYDDVLIRPALSSVLPTEVDLKTKLSQNVSLEIPIISSAMDTVTDANMALAMGKIGGLGVIHKNYSIKEQVQEVLTVKEQKHLVGAAVGVGPKELERAKALIDSGVDLLVVDTAHGHSQGVIKALQSLKALNSSKTDVMVGNIATLEAAKALVESGADVIKVGVGPGSICTTRIVAGVGVPQLQALIDCSEYLRDKKISFVADGGIRYSGDIVKALGAGASCVMLGSLLAATDESASEGVMINGVLYKRYRGMGSLTSMGLGSSDRYGQGEIKEDKKYVPEGIEGLVKSKGSLDSNIYQLLGGLRSGMGYVGARTLEELESNAIFERVSSLSVAESHPHDVKIEFEAPNYYR